MSKVTEPVSVELRFLSRSVRFQGSCSYPPRPKREDKTKKRIARGWEIWARVTFVIVALAPGTSPTVLLTMWCSWPQDMETETVSSALSKAFLHGGQKYLLGRFPLNLSSHSSSVFKGKWISDVIWCLGQWLRSHAPNAGGLGSIPGQGARSHTPQLGVWMLQWKTLHAATKTKDPVCHS